MKIERIAQFVFLLFLLSVVLAGPASGDKWDKKTVVTFNELVEIPGGMPPAGTYVFKLSGSLGYRHVVQVWNKDETEVLATILAIPNHQMEPTGETNIKFHERPSSGPLAVQAWFYPGDNFGQEFVYYPKRPALLLAELSNVVVPAETIEPNKENLKSVPLIAITPSGKEAAITEAIQTMPMPEKTAFANPAVTQALESSSADRQAGPQATFEALTELVVLPVSVTDGNGNFVSGLTSRNFRVYENGRLQSITLFEREDLPVTVGLIVDHSRSMGAKLSAVATAVSSFAHSSNPEDEMFVVDFSDRVWPEFFGGQPFTSNTGELEAALMSVAAEGETALYDALYEGLERLRIGHRDKKALIIVSDGGDNASRHKYTELLALAHQSQALIYAIGLVGQSGQEENPRVLERICKDTAGLAFFPRSVDMVKEISVRIAHDLRQQYTIGYAPEKQINGNAFRKIQVKVSAPGRGKLHVRTRPGYSAAGNKQSRAASRGPA